jgi:MFS family permease
LVASLGWRVFPVYYQILRAPRVTRLVLAMFVGRLPNGMFPLGVVLLLHQTTGSYGTSGAALAALMVGTTVSAPFRGRAVDRWGHATVAIPLVLVQTAAMACFLLVALSRQNVVLEASLVSIVGASSSTLGGSMRRIWPVLVPSAGDLPAAYALQAFLEDLLSVAGPLIASVLLAFASPSAILITGELAAFGGTLLFVTARSDDAVPRRPARRSGALYGVSTPGMRTLVLSMAALGAAMGMLYVAVPAFAERGNGSANAGVLLAALYASSMLSGFCYGARAWRSDPGRRYMWLAVVFATLTVPLAAAGDVAELGVLLTLVGIAYAPRMVSAYLLLDKLAPEGSAAEAYTWLVSANAAGVALGSAIAGPITQGCGARWALAATTCCAVAGGLLSVLRQRSLRPDLPTRGTLWPANNSPDDPGDPPARPGQQVLLPGSQQPGDGPKNSLSHHTDH